jgi:uncharacterized membrane protein (UPF0182 family)
VSGIRMIWILFLVVAGFTDFMLFAKIPTDFQAVSDVSSISLVRMLSYMATAIYIFSFIVPRLLLSKVILKKFVNSSDEDKVIRLRVLTLYSFALLAGLILTNAAVILGYLAGFIGHRPAIYVPFFFIGIITLALRYPSEKRFGRVLNHLKSVS